VWTDDKRLHNFNRESINEEMSWNSCAWRKILTFILMYIMCWRGLVYNTGDDWQRAAANTVMIFRAPWKVENS
jgi:hypothetical protein